MEPQVVQHKSDPFWKFAAGGFIISASGLGPLVVTLTVIALLGILLWKTLYWSFYGFRLLILGILTLVAYPWTRTWHLADPKPQQQPIQQPANVVKISDYK